ncbi:MAG TPA: efflux RND transporter periplasmic adaptor subunit [Steroidobacter sp.]|nr:efflux RND transporter periplasmic adaptor subunit [Steroidobacter sp.]
MRIRPLAATLTSAVLLSACRPAIEESAPAPTPVRATAAVEGPGAPLIQTNGLLANKDEIRLSFKVGGVVRSISVREGQRVRKGQRLAEIERTEINAQVEQTRQAYAKAQRDLERGERLYGDKVISLEQLQDLRTQAAVAEAALQSAEFNSSYAAIIAPREGIIMRRLAEERELVAAGSPVIVLGAHDAGFVVRAGLADREVVQFRLGDAAEISLDALPGTTLKGKVTEVAGAADPTTGMFGVEVSLEPTNLPLRSGLVAKLTLSPASARTRTRVYVPIGAVVEGEGRTARVFVIDNQTARRRDVEVAFIEGERVALESGLAPGEQIVTDGAQYLEDEEAVTIAEAAVAHQPAE